MLPPEVVPGDYRLHVVSPPAFRNLIIECGNIYGVVLGSWTNFNGSGSSEVDDDSGHAGYWAAAAVWSNAWDQTTIDRVSCISSNSSVKCLNFLVTRGF